MLYSINGSFLLASSPPPPPGPLILQVPPSFSNSSIFPCVFSSTFYSDRSTFSIVLLLSLQYKEAPKSPKCQGMESVFSLFYNSFVKKCSVLVHGTACYSSFETMCIPFTADPGDGSKRRVSREYFLWCQDYRRIWRLQLFSHLSSIYFCSWLGINPFLKGFSFRFFTFMDSPRPK